MDSFKPLSILILKKVSGGIPNPIKLGKIFLMAGVLLNIE